MAPKKTLCGVFFSFLPLHSDPTFHRQPTRLSRGQPKLWVFPFLMRLDLEGASRKTRETADRSLPLLVSGCRTGMHHAAWNIDHASAW